MRSLDRTVKAVGNAAIDRHRVADASRHAHFHAVAKAAGDRSIVIQAKITEDPDDVAIDTGGLRLFDDQRAHQAAPYLLGAVRMRVVPVSAGIRDRKLVSEVLLRPDRRLRDIGRAVHRVRNPQAVPMDRGVLGEPIVDGDSQPIALAQSDFRAGDAAGVAPDAGL
jgi:hypothetical protein